MEFLATYIFILIILVCYVIQLPCITVFSPGGSSTTCYYHYPVWVPIHFCLLERCFASATTMGQPCTTFPGMYSVFLLEAFSF